MKLIHTSDWHFGMPLGTGSYRECQQFFLQQMYDLIRRENVEAVLCALMLAAGIGLTLAMWRGAIG